MDKEQVFTVGRNFSNEACKRVMHEHKSDRHGTFYLFYDYLDLEFGIDKLECQCGLFM